MQDIHSIGGGGGGGGRLYGVSGGDRRLRPQHNGLTNGPPTLKCPRCESLNTKFCYYNNYNLSQPRHFCKNCRRYWTVGGVLRNVPVGGGCRKKKRSKPKSGNRNPSSDSGVRKSSNSHNSSSESSSLTATTTAANTTAMTTAAVPVTVAEALSGINSTNTTTASFRFLQNPSFDPPLLDNHLSAVNGIFPEIDVLTGLMTSSTTPLPQEFNIFAGVSPFWLHHTGRTVENSNVEQQQWMIEDRTPSAEFSGLAEKTIDGGVGTDWNNCTDEGLFDLTGTLDQSYWNQTRWDDDHDHDIPRQHDDHDLNYLR